MPRDVHIHLTRDDRPITENATERADLRLSKADKALYDKLGGTTWVRRILDAERRKRQS